METLLHTKLLLSAEVESLKSGSFDQTYVKKAEHIISGESYQLVQQFVDKFKGKISISGEISTSSVIAALNDFLNVEVFKMGQENEMLFLAIAFLQTFIQNNYTGPAARLEAIPGLFGKTGIEIGAVNTALSRSLAIMGQPAYEFMDDPLYMVLSLLLLERITGQKSLFDVTPDQEVPLPIISAESTPGLLAVAYWWWARALLTQLSLIPEPSGFQASVASAIYQSADLAYAITKELPESIHEDFKRELYAMYYLENVKCSLAINTEHLCLPSLTRAKKITNFEFVMTGARATRTKYQQKAHAGLIILAKSFTFQNFALRTTSATPETFALESDLLLEKPHFESIADEPLDEQIYSKRQKVDLDAGYEEDKLLPLALRQENIPKSLLDLNPNDQPTLSDYDNVQLLLRLYTIKNTTPAKDPLVEEELTSLLSRILYQNGEKNWSIFARSLWERSIIETTKAKTIERGLLQMQSLVEELDLKIKSKLVPSSNEINVASRLSYIHQLPFIPRWQLDATLAEKYMSLGILKSAVEIYERLGMACETALCYAAVGDEKKAEEILLQRINENDSDARAYSILGDIKQDPSLWEKSWEIGKYVNAKNSLAKYYFNPPPKSGVQPNYSATLKHLNDSLRQYPLSFETWYFYGCVGLQCGKMQIAAEAFTRCVSLDPYHALSWSNLSAAYTKMDKLKEAYSCLKRAISCDAQKNWKIWENYMLVAVKLNEWEDVLTACKQLVSIRRDKSGEGSIDLPVIEKLVELLVTSEYPEEPQQLSYFQKSCTEFICNTLPQVITTSARCWRLVARVELWRKRPWAALECHEKAYRAISHNPDLEVEEKVWNDTVDACEDLVAAYESLGEMEGKYGPGSLVCKDWKYKCRSTIKALMSKGKGRWDDSPGWDRLVEARSQI
ncbi:BCN_G0043850.mRNA.1.CDS.1 [Saccharomyces cerevisiae]|nr:BCN_G0043850.mRNA.1.CDS.1 [Saccharomyces cerevisiae]CAI4721897.1 BCE_3a_G0043850.mRNA.1.CDS.1 [Saccharomyces cerevisiae]CAI7289599.1 BCN_G0043850.mRNA.1.CDS.1 [Saccharomyces cerevisiae]CAI7292933.1 BCE_3a_G0043850.mRNA.1.CDS.1 [Saccharomyces cerevisiae]